MKRFNKYTALNKLSNKNNSKTKKRTIIISVIVLIIGILYFSFARFESTQTFNLISGTANIQNISLIEKINELKTNGSPDLEYDGVEVLGELGTNDNNLRYVGATPNNYVYFNCNTTNPDEMNDDTCEKWRIIGVFNNIEDENGKIASRVKIIRDEVLGKYSWDTSDNSINDGNGVNQWGESGAYEGADLMRELNTDYLGNITVGTDGKWYSGLNNLKAKDMPASTLSTSAQSMIESVKWNLGSPSNNNGEYESNFDNLIPSTIYLRERANTNGKLCSSGINYYGSNSYQCEDMVVRTSIWIGKVALIYPSDYGYATSGGSTINREICLNTSMSNWNNEDLRYCSKNNYLVTNESQWTLSPFAAKYSAVSNFDVWESGAAKGYNASGCDIVRPVVFLQSDITITRGNGSSTNPYTLG